MSKGELWPRTNLLALYHLEDLTDSSGNSKTLTNNNSVTFTSGKFSNGANFGTNNTNKGLVASNLGWGVNDNLTIMFWTRMLTEIGSGSYCLCNIETSTDGSAENYIVYQYNGGTRRLDWEYRTSHNYYNVTLGTTNYYHLACTRDGAATYIYLNGNKVATGSAGSTGGGGTSFGLGYDANNGANFSSCMIDEAAVYKEAWTPSQIKQYYNWASGKRAKLI